MRSILNLVLILCTLPILTNAQVDTPVPNSENGWYLSPTGTIRILVIFAEIEYDKNPARDPQPNAADHWPKGQLPKWKDDMFDPHASVDPKGMVSKYYHDISLGQYVVLGDYVNKLMTIKESEHRSMSNLSKLAITEANKMESLNTAHGFTIEDFDMWKDTRKQGLPKEQGPDEKHRYDHIMTIVRNSGLRHGAGSTDPGSSMNLFGFGSDSQSRFGAMNGLPFEILKHEYNHLLLGGNNFHSGGGNAAQFAAYFTCLQGGWSMMGSASSSLLTCSGWDRYRLGWKASGKQHLISAWNEKGEEVNGDLDPLNGDTGIFILNDMVTKGDLLRIKIPYLPEDEYQQWLWIENHQGAAKNGSYTDNFHWANHATCSPKAIPGIYMLMQVSRENKVGKSIYSGYADYLRPLLANGNSDLVLSDEVIEKTCPFNGRGQIFDRRTKWANPLSGNHEQELPLVDKNNDGRLSRSEHYVPSVRRMDGKINAQVTFFGRPEHVFTLSNNERIGMGTNPTTANMTTLLRSANRYIGDPNTAPNNRNVYLNGLSVEILEETPAGSIKIWVRANDTYLTEDVRWATDSIILPAIEGYKGYSLYLAENKTIILNRSGTPTRNENPEEYKGETYWNDATTFTIDSGATAMLSNKSKIDMEDASSLYLKKGATLELGEGAQLNICADCKFVMEEGSKIILHEKSKVNNKGSISDQGMELFQYCKGELVTQGDKSAFE